MRMHIIEYNGKMNDCFPAWVFTTATDYALDVTRYKKVYEYLKGIHGKKKVKIDLAVIVEISPYDVLDYMAITSTWFSVGGVQYHVLQAIKMYVSDVVSSVNETGFVLGDSDGNVLFEVV